MKKIMSNRTEKTMYLGLVKIFTAPHEMKDDFSSLTILPIS